jgi:hypothetical protein
VDLDCNRIIKCSRSILQILTIKWLSKDLKHQTNSLITLMKTNLSSKETMEKSTVITKKTMMHSVITWDKVSMVVSVTLVVLQELIHLRFPLWTKEHLNTEMTRPNQMVQLHKQIRLQRKTLQRTMECFYKTLHKQEKMHNNHYKDMTHHYGYREVEVRTMRKEKEMMLSHNHQRGLIHSMR